MTLRAVTRVLPINKAGSDRSACNVRPSWIRRPLPYTEVTDMNAYQ